MEKYIRSNLDSNFTLKCHSFLKATTTAMEEKSVTQGSDSAGKEDSGYCIEDQKLTPAPHSTTPVSGKASGKKPASKGKSSRVSPSNVDSSSGKEAITNKDSSPARKDPASNGIKKKKRKLSEVNQRSGGAAKAAVSKKAKLSGSDQGCVVKKATTSTPWKWDLETRTDTLVIEGTELDPLQATDAGEGSTAATEREGAGLPQPANENGAETTTGADTTTGDGSKEGEVSVAGNGSPLEDIAEASVSMPAHGRGTIKSSQVGSTSWTDANPLSTSINIPPQDFSSPMTTPMPTSARKYCSLSSSSEDEALPNLESDSEEEDWPCLDLSVNENIKSE